MRDVKMVMSSCVINVRVSWCWHFIFSGLVVLAGLPIIVHPSGVSTASWFLSLLGTCWMIIWACIQSLPRRSIVGQFCLVGNLEERCERPGIDNTSVGVGMSCITLGRFWVKAFSRLIGGSPDQGDIIKI